MATVSSDQQVYNAGQDAILNCSAMGGPGNVFQWQRNGSDIENSSTLILSNVSAFTGGEYSCIVTNAAGNNTANLTLLISPTFTTQPANSITTAEAMATLTCVAEGFPAPDYQWSRVNGMGIRDGVNGRNMSMLVFSPVLFGDEGEYICSANTSGVSIQSQPATLTSKLLV